MTIKKYRGVTAAVGLPGAGKSYYLAEQARRGMMRGVPVYSNAGFDVQGTETIASFEEFAGLEGPAVVVWDELPLYFSARRWADFPDGMLYKFTQIRKDAIELYYSTIHPMMVDATLRRITFEWVEHHHVAGRLMRRTHWVPGGFQSEAYVVSHRSMGWLRKRTMELYETMGRVRVHDPGRLDGLPDGSWELPAWAPGGGSRLRVPPGTAEGNGLGRHSIEQETG